MTAFGIVMASGSTSTGDSSGGGTQSKTLVTSNDVVDTPVVPVVNAQVNVQYSPRRLVSKLGEKSRSSLGKTKSAGHEGTETDENHISLVYPKLYLGK